MKKCLLIVLLILSVSFSFSCGGGKCTNHIDSDLNGKCDVCDADFKTKAPCEEHMDENKDGECDVCGADFKTNAPCEEHTDENKDGKCDVCGADFKTNAPCEEHTDENKDGKCDVCDGDVEIDVACTEHTDADENGICDICDMFFEIKTVYQELKIVENSTPTFGVVYSKTLSKEGMAAVESLKNALLSVGVTIEPVIEDQNKKFDCEVLIGDVTTRGYEYYYSQIRMGEDAYTVKLKNSKIIINAGSQKLLADAVNAFVEKILCINEDTEKLDDEVVMTTKKEIHGIISELNPDVFAYVKVNNTFVRGIKTPFDAENSDVKAFCDGDFVMIPILYATSALNASSVSITNDGAEFTVPSGKRVSVKVNSAECTVDGKTHTLSKKITLYNGILYICAADAAELFEKNYFYDRCGYMLIGDFGELTLEDFDTREELVDYATELIYDRPSGYELINLLKARNPDNSHPRILLTQSDFDELKSLILILASVALWYIGYNSITSKYSVYATNVLFFDFNFTLIIAQAAAVIAYIPVGMVASKIGRRKTILAGIAMLASAFFIGNFIS